jgi:glucose dehydrogenase
LLAIAVAGGMSSAALANDDVLKLSKDPANVVMPSITYNGWNYSELNQITTANVKDLSVAWTWQVGVLDSHEASPWSSATRCMSSPRSPTTFTPST